MLPISARRSHFDSKRPENFVRIATFPSATFGPLFAFHCPLFFTKNNHLEWKSSRFATRDVMKTVTMTSESFWVIHCAHRSSGFMVLNASISRVLGQRPTFYSPLFVLCFDFHEKQEIRRRQFPAIDVWFSRCCRVETVDGATVVAMAIAVQTDPTFSFIVDR